MSIDSILDEAMNLRPVERLALAQRLWESIAADTDAPPLTDAEKAAINAELAAHRDDPSDTQSCDAIIADLRRRMSA